MTHLFEIEGEVYLPFDGRLYKVDDETTDIEEIVEEDLYLHNGTVGKFKINDNGYDVVFTPYKNQSSTVAILDSEDFDSARRLHSLVPKDVEECPECGGWAGDVEKENTPHCLSCGYRADS